MEIKKPEPFHPEHSMESIIEEVKKSLFEEGILDGHEEQYHAKIAKDYLIIGSYLHSLPEEGNALLDPYKHNLFAGYFTIVKVTEYKMEVEDYINTYQSDFNKMMKEESLAGNALKSALLVEDIIGKEIIDKILDMEMVRFLGDFVKERWPDVIEMLEGMSDDQIKNYAEEITNQNKGE